MLISLILRDLLHSDTHQCDFIQQMIVIVTEWFKTPKICNKMIQNTKIWREHYHNNTGPTTNWYQLYFRFRRTHLISCISSLSQKSSQMRNCWKIHSGIHLILTCACVYSQADRNINKSHLHDNKSQCVHCHFIRSTLKR